MAARVTPPETSSVHHVVIVGGGFGGLYAARALGKDPRIQLTLIDRRNHHLFQPLLYQVATGALSPGEIAQPLRSILRRNANTRVLLGEAVGIAPDERCVVLADGARIPYDTLIVATGARHSYFGHEDWASIAPGLKSIDDATEIRRRILIAFEAAEREADPALRAAWLMFVVAGGGPTGVELAGALGEIAFDTLKRDFRAIDPASAQIHLVEANDRVLAQYPPAQSASAQRQLEKLGVTVHTGTSVVGMGDGWVDIRPTASPAAEPTRIEARTVLWAAGVLASSFGRVVAEATGSSTDRAGRVIVAPDLSVPGHPEILVIGDAALQPWKDGRYAPGVAQGAIQAGKYAAKAVRRRLDGQPVGAFRYQDRGDVAVIGRLAGVTNIGWLGPFGKQSGFLAWALWLTIHITYLIGFANRIVVVVRWAWSFLTHGRGSRLITGQPLVPPLRDPDG